LEAARQAFGRAILDETAVAQISRRLLEAARQAFGRAILAARLRAGAITW